MSCGDAIQVAYGRPVSHPTWGQVVADCKVDIGHVSTPGFPNGSEHVLVPGKIGDFGSQTYIADNNVVYRRNGVTIREFNHKDLRLPQKRTFLGPEIYNQGCMGLYGRSSCDVVAKPADDGPRAKEMWDYLFSGSGIYVGSGAMTQ